MKTFLVYFTWTEVLEIEAEEIRNLAAGVVALLDDGKTVATFSYAQIIGIVEKDKIQAERTAPVRH